MENKRERPLGDPIYDQIPGSLKHKIRRIEQYQDAYRFNRIILIHAVSGAVYKITLPCRTSWGRVTPELVSLDYDDLVKVIFWLDSLSS